MVTFGEIESLNITVYGGITFVMTLFTMIVLVNITKRILHCFCNILFLCYRCFAHDSYFQQKHDACNILGLTSTEKCIFATSMLTYNVILNVCDEYCKLGDAIAMETLNFFCKDMTKCFESMYLE
jgi:hypothetical protein